MAGAAPQASLSPAYEQKDYADKIREMIRHEDSVLGQRVTWCGTIQGLLLASMGFAWEKAPAGFVYVVSAAGVFIAISTLYASIITVNTMVDLIKKWEGRESLGWAGPPIIGRDARRWNPVFRPSRAIPGAFVLLWPIVSIIRFVKG